MKIIAKILSIIGFGWVGIVTVYVVAIRLVHTYQAGVLKFFERDLTDWGTIWFMFCLPGLILALIADWLGKKFTATPVATE